MMGMTDKQRKNNVNRTPCTSIKEWCEDNNYNIKIMSSMIGRDKSIIPAINRLGGDYYALSDIKAWEQRNVDKIQKALNK